MFVLDEPYISDFLFDTLNKNNYPVFLNNLTKGRAKNLRTDILPYKVYANSENSFSDIFKLLKNTELPQKIALFKDKAKTRALLQKIYPDFFFKRVKSEELEKLNPDDFKYPFVIKPTVGFLSFGVETVWNPSELSGVIQKIKTSLKDAKNVFPENVLSDEYFILEEFIGGDEYAADVYYTEKGAPVILNIYKHPFADKFDVSDRMYITSAKIVKEHLTEFTELFEKIGKLAGLENFPAHIELRIQNGKPVPIEINPLRFAGWCLCDLAYYAYGINPYEYFMENKSPDWQRVKNDDIFAFILCEVPSSLNRNSICGFDYGKFEKAAGVDILEVRKYDYRVKPLFCSMFVKAKKYEQLAPVLKFNMNDFVRVGAGVI